MMNNCYAKGYKLRLKLLAFEIFNCSETNLTTFVKYVHLTIGYIRTDEKIPSYAFRLRIYGVRVRCCTIP